jgi:hypothetical protein
MSKYFTPITELPGDSGKSQSASSMVQYKTVSNNKFEKKLAPTTKFVEPQKMFPESTNSPVSHSRKFLKRGSKITKANLGNTAENMIRAAKVVGEIKGGVSGNFMDSFLRLFPDATDQRQVVDELADALNDSSGKKKANIENILGDFLATNPVEINGKPANAADVVGIMFGELTRRTKDAPTISDKRSALVRGTSFRGEIHPKDDDAPFERIFARPPASTSSGATPTSTSSGATPTSTSSGMPRLPPSSTSSSASTASTGFAPEKEIDVPHGVLNVGSHLKGVFGNIIPLATAPFTQYRRNQAITANARNMETAIENIMEDFPKLTKDQATTLANNFKNSDGDVNTLFLGTNRGASIGAKSRAADELASAKRAENRAEEFKQRLDALNPRKSQFKRSAVALANDAAIIGGLGYAGYNMAFGDKNRNQSSPQPMQPTSMQTTPTTAFVPPPPMDLSQSKPLDKWKPVSDPSLMGKRMKKRGSVKKINIGNAALDQISALHRIAEAERLASGVGDVVDDLGTRRLTTTTPTTKPPVAASSPFDATLGDIYTTGPLDGLLGMGMSAIPSIRSAASRAGGAIGTGAGRAAGAIRSGAGRAAGAASRAASAAPSAIASSPRRFVNAVGVLGGPKVQDFGRTVADVFDSSKGKWIDRMQNAYEDVRGIKRPWETPTVNDPFGLGIDVPTKAKEPLYEIPYPNLDPHLDPLDPEYRWKRYANDVRQTATDPRRAWRRKRPWVIGGAGLLGAGTYYGLNALNSGDQSSAPAPAPAAISAPRVTPTPAPAPVAEPASEPQVNEDGDLTTGDQTRDTQIAQKYRNYITYIDEKGVLRRGQYQNSDVKGQIDPRQQAELDQLVYGLIKENLPKLAKSSKTEIDDFFNTFVQSQITQMQYNKAAKQGGFELPQSVALGSYMPYLNDTQTAALKLGKSPTTTIYNTTNPRWWDGTNWTVYNNTTDKPVEKSMGNKNKYGNDRSVIQKSMTSPVDKFNSTPKKNKYKDK